MKTTLKLRMHPPSGVLEDLASGAVTSHDIVTSLPDSPGGGGTGSIHFAIWLPPSSFSRGGGPISSAQWCPSSRGAQGRCPYLPHPRYTTASSFHSGTGLEQSSCVEGRSPNPGMFIKALEIFSCPTRLPSGQSLAPTALSSSWDGRGEEARVSPDSGEVCHECTSPGQTVLHVRSTWRQPLCCRKETRVECAHGLPWLVVKVILVGGLEELGIQTGVFAIGQCKVRGTRLMQV